jgi:hypothetical protein
VPGAFIPNPVGLAELLESPVGAVGRDTVRRGEKLLAEARRRCPVGKTKKLRDGLTITFAGKGVTLISDQPYAEFVVKGTRPHVIEPRGARVLAFESNGEMVFATRVSHPGTKPNNFAEEALKAAMGESVGG